MSQPRRPHTSRGYQQVQQQAKGITMKQIVIIGAGYAGMAATTGLVRRASGRPTAVSYLRA
jgi:hypothetical protein